MESHDTFDRRLAQERFLLVGFIAAACRGRVASSDVVEDLVQDTLAIAWTRRSEFDASRPLGPWLRGIAVKVVMGSVRREARRRRIAMDDAHEIVRIEGLAERFAAIEDQLDGRQLAEGVRGCVQALPPTFREVLERHYGGGQSISEIAVELGISDDLASKRAIRGRALVARCLRSKGLAPGSEVRDAADARDEDPS